MTIGLNMEVSEEVACCTTGSGYQQLNKQSEMTCLSESGWKWLEISGVSEMSDYPVV